MPKFAPPIVTGLPMVPELGDKLVIEGADPTVKRTPFELTPPTVTSTAPVVAPAGTGTLIDALPQVVGVATVPLKATVLLPLLVPKFSPVTVTEVPTGPRFGETFVMVGTELTVNVGALLARPPTVTTTRPVEAPEGTGALMDVFVHVDGVAVMPLKVRELLPWVVPKLLPLIVTVVPTGPRVGDKLVMLGAEFTVNVTALLAIPPTVTITGPVVPAAGIGTTICDAVQFCTTPAVPLKVTLLVPCASPKFVPAMVTGVPVPPEVGDKEAMLGVGKAVNVTPLLATPLAFTTTGPVSAPAGTKATI